MIWPGADSELVYEAEQSLGRALPGFYKQFLLNINGCFLYDISMFGLNQYFTRSVLQCHSLLTANQEWIREYNIDQNLFYFGEGSYSESENTGYFYGGNRFYAIRREGTVVKEWSEFALFLRDELSRAEREMLKEVPNGVKLTISQ
jgi:hypothetical protein